MKVKNLMVGDFIQIMNGIGEWVAANVTQLCHFNSDDILYIMYKDINGYNGYVSETSEYIRGIELTEELLLKNGFVGSCYLRLNFVDDKHKYYEYYPFEHRLILYYEGIDEWQNNAHVKEVLFRCPCRYVHELQHAFKMWDDFAYLADKIIV